VNLEVDLIARYLERLILGEHASEQDIGSITEDFLRHHGFMR
jgi:riboflavin synthase